jgi:hypothetical protein
LQGDAIPPRRRITVLAIVAAIGGGLGLPAGLSELATRLEVLLGVYIAIGRVGGL